MGVRLLRGRRDGGRVRAGLLELCRDHEHVARGAGMRVAIRGQREPRRPDLASTEG